MLLDNEGEFGAAQNDALRSALSELFHLLEHIFLALRLEDTPAQLLLDNSMEFLPSRSGTGHEGFNSVMLLQPVRHKSIFHRVQSSDQPNLLQTATSDCNSGSIPN